MVWLVGWVGDPVYTSALATHWFPISSRERRVRPNSMAAPDSHRKCRAREEDPSGAT